MIKELVIQNRSYRKFHNSKKLTSNQLADLVDIARLTPSSKNRQPLKYLLVTKDDDVNFVFGHLKWAWHLKHWDGPEKSQQPPSYIVMCIDKDLNDQALIDSGIAAQTILLAATEKKLGGCIIRTVNRYAIGKHFNLSKNIEVVQVIAIGYPDQDIELTPVLANGSVVYYEDNTGKHFVPKRELKDIIIPT
jgi:nitroreductase